MTEWAACVLRGWTRQLAASGLRLEYQTKVLRSAISGASILHQLPRVVDYEHPEANSYVYSLWRPTRWLAIAAYVSEQFAQSAGKPGLAVYMKNRYGHAL
jgi:hypothetical protein